MTSRVNFPPQPPTAEMTERELLLDAVHRLRSFNDWHLVVDEWRIDVDRSLEQQGSQMDTMRRRLADARWAKWVGVAGLLATVGAKAADLYLMHAGLK